MQRKLTDAKIKHLKPKDRGYKTADGGGLYVFTNTKGTKSFRYDFKHQDKYATITLGQYPNLSLSEARKLHEKAYNEVLNNIDPRAQKDAEKLLEQPFSFYAQEMMSTQDLRPTTAKKKLAKMERHLFKPLDTKPVHLITAVDLLNLLKPIADKGKRETAKDLATYCRQTFNYLLSLQLIENNPAATIAELLPKPKKSANFAHITNPKELAKLLRGIDTYEGDISIKHALQLMPLVMLRPYNIRFMKWEYVDIENRLVTIPADEMKMEREHKIPLSNQAIDILNQASYLSKKNEYVFLSAYGLRTGKPMSENTLNQAVIRIKDEQTGEPIGRGIMTSHGFRHTASTMLNELGYNSDAIELQLAHASKDRIRATYNKAELLPERTAMMQKWADYLDGLKNG
ncbi:MULTISPECIES: tyrosine-type recombinase/integrase [unclassified Neptuniibacter]|uniref:tyrosine-type recombinase/integrase n=1 Tax=unclassified Neptuniibacter TaxID=2630693 RepID=UPI000C3504A9|nr:MULTISPECIES: tyrosine-type recombinase/integrase [unclassified Neptuniibacter]MAY41900.1 integrase [Oceanospirillaceae bacterium]|tara:strand:+ start:293 stop:1492 length:1200 start_codon:yes stop_codon:yes gene_type:complete